MAPRGSSEIGSKGVWPSSDDLYFAALLCYFSLQPPTVSLLLTSIPLLTPLGRNVQTLRARLGTLPSLCTLADTFGVQLRAHRGLLGQG